MRLQQNYRCVLPVLASPGVLLPPVRLSGGGETPLMSLRYVRLRKVAGCSGVCQNACATTVTLRLCNLPRSSWCFPHLVQCVQDLLLCVRCTTRALDLEAAVRATDAVLKVRLRPAGICVLRAFRLLALRVPGLRRAFQVECTRRCRSLWRRLDVTRSAGALCGLGARRSRSR